VRGLLSDRSCPVETSQGELYHLHLPQGGRVGVGPDFRLVCKRNLPPPSPPSPSSLSSKVCRRPVQFPGLWPPRIRLRILLLSQSATLANFLLHARMSLKSGHSISLQCIIIRRWCFFLVGFEFRLMPAKPPGPAGLITLSGVATLVTPIPADHDGAPVKTVLFDGILATAAVQPPPLTRLGPHSIIFIFSSHFGSDACIA